MADPRQQGQRWYFVDPPDTVRGNVTGEGVIDQNDAATHLRLDTSISSGSGGDETNLSLLIDAATDYAEDAMSIVLMPKTIVATFYDGEPIILPRGPLIDVEDIRDAAGKRFTCTGRQRYTIRNVGHQTELLLAAGATYPVAVEYRAGYPDRGRIPAAIRLAILAHVGTLYEARESTSDKPRTAVPHHLDAFYRLKRRGVGVG